MLMIIMIIELLFIISSIMTREYTIKIIAALVGLPIIGVLFFYIGYLAYLGAPVSIYFDGKQLSARRMSGEVVKARWWSVESVLFVPETCFLAVAIKNVRPGWNGFFAKEVGEAIKKKFDRVQFDIKHLR